MPKAAATTRTEPAPANASSYALAYRPILRRRALSSKPAPSASLTWAAFSGLLPPAAAVVGLPIGHGKAARFGLAPARTRSGDRLLVIAVEQHDDALVLRRLGRHRCAVNHEAHLGRIGVMLVHRQQYRLHRRFLL